MTTNGGPNRGTEYLRAVKDVTASSFVSEEDRAEALQATYEAVFRLESPWETYTRLYLNIPAVMAGLKVIKDLDLMNKWHEKGNIPMTSVELAELVGGCDSQLLHRFLRLLAANGLLKQVPTEKFKPNQFCVEISNPEFSTVIDFYFLVTRPAFDLLPAHLAERGHKNPIDPNDTPVKELTGHESMWSYLKETPKAGETFNILQKFSTMKEPAWMEMYPHEKLVDESDPNYPLLVDIGGGIGQDILRFYTAYPELASRIYLEDLPEVIADANEKAIIPNNVNKLEYNFFTPQPIKSARAYFMHHIIHDWPDASAQKILEMQKSAMKPGYSRLLIHENVLDGEKSLLGPTSLDITMMVCLAGQERTEKQWLALFDSVGLKVIKFWKKPPGTFNIIEVEVPLSPSY
ncbi:S-adenosyl-L-methionine-dependent methyltransferase [Colletotrichum navitas]|uniref:S-adenosyl-L-methionine-dependent methyltransferase n=1 Tax=Colletotrichum navitas TaxID=681940 RepID=A0AAD8UYW7_9PEZI|nr:S-adenosyl-L-methionine-dependent methyltransferase [Colletotrichum navitas]KAK1566271.1 S-adenosyl-L-methionine-dependent methyltransferase [Colletotrichum navitas]